MEVDDGEDDVSDGVLEDDGDDEEEERALLELGLLDAEEDVGGMLLLLLLVGGDEEVDADVVECELVDIVVDVAVEVGVVGDGVVVS